MEPLGREKLLLYCNHYPLIEVSAIKDHRHGKYLASYRDYRTGACYTMEPKAAELRERDECRD
jgi:hypothetical protein